MQESPVIPHTLVQVLSLILASSLGWIGGWISRRKREPVEIAKLEAETKQIHTSADLSFGTVTLETLREIQAVIDKAERRREEWHLKEEQMRGQIVHWRCKAEELDGELQDSRTANGQYETRAKLHEYQIRRLKSLLDYHNISYAELDQPKDR